MNLSNLIEAIRPIRISGQVAMPTEINSIHYRAQDVKPGGLFTAIPGFRADGHDFIAEALSKGAAAIVSQKPVKGNAVMIEVENSRKALAAVSARFYGNPSEKLNIIGITGTNGKTTTTYLIESILANAGFNVGVIGTINYRYAGNTFQNPVTTPESTDLQQILAQMLAAGITHVVMEVSSHAIDLFRMEHCWLDIGVFVNLSQDHLDYHGDMNTYWQCKKRLFTDNLAAGPKQGRTLSVINCNDPKGLELVRSICIQSLTIGHADTNKIRYRHLKLGLNGMTCEILTPKGNFELQSTLVGKHNLENILCAVGVGIAINIAPNTIKTGIGEVTGVPGRLEPIPNSIGRFVYVDYAHTPDALENVLSALTALSSGKMICVFGCGGDRDKSKRPQMGEIAAGICDRIIITSDNPRTEKPDEIILQILEGVKRSSLAAYDFLNPTKDFEQKGYWIEPDRRQAIRAAIEASRPGDTILIAGKGHETYQIIGNKVTPFDDRQEARIAMADLADSLWEAQMGDRRR
ncbi:MAG: UDP-N-acetylmuramoyl-L-alanyl-D-glutamate--2,6-diaminopimelate ligase [Desulfobacterales bacterium]|nr:UDP-N-acetylmuramoyl-L-alanyl-D-glutamate--2,6-diaminopimelate ligase [Desulfobacterales bacterium]